MKTLSRYDSALKAVLLSLLLCPAVFGGGVPEWRSGRFDPSENKGRRGRYHAETGHPGYNYFVYVPDSYSEDNPAGIHIFFHGQGSQGSAKSFHHWAKYFLEPYNLIGINMEYTDGDNAKDTTGKVHAAEEALAQVIADYRIVQGRGVISSFSGGGLPHKGIFQRYAGRERRDRSPWLFNHTAIYGSNFWAPANGSIPMSWFIGLGGQEWNMGKPTLGQSQPARANELISDALKGKCPDVHLKIIKEKGHAIADEDVEASARQFARSDLAFAPFVYQADYLEKELLPIAAAANSLLLGQASSALDRLIGNPRLDAAVKQKALALRKTLDNRVDAVIELTRELAAKDPVLCNYYGKLFMSQLMRHPRQKELRKILGDTARTPRFRRALAAFQPFATNFTSFFTNARLSEKKAQLVEQILAASGGDSLVGTMCREFLLLRE